MHDSYPLSRTNKVRQLAELAHYDRETVHRILDAGLVAHAAFVQDGAPIVVPMIYGRDGDIVYLHGARKARVIRMLEQTDKACLNVTLLDGIVLARSAFNSSMEYRSATVFGTPRLVDDPAVKLSALRIISEHTMPGRWDEVRDSHDREVKMTGVIAFEIETGSAKISDQGVEDDGLGWRAATDLVDRLADRRQTFVTGCCTVGRGQSNAKQKDLVFRNACGRQVPAFDPQDTVFPSFDTSRLIRGQP
jgi:nitroimidazol reductase NimA-like FMN-containing flavoprotein (pyridoxamine 5'-phosphate oxidase superfamily)